MRKFEVGAGLTLKNVWEHVEAVQVRAMARFRG